MKRVSLVVTISQLDWSYLLLLIAIAAQDISRTRRALPVLFHNGQSSTTESQADRSNTRFPLIPFHWYIKRNTTSLRAAIFFESGKYFKAKSLLCMSRYFQDPVIFIYIMIRQEIRHMIFLSTLREKNQVSIPRKPIETCRKPRVYKRFPPSFHTNNPTFPMVPTT